VVGLVAVAQALEDLARSPGGGLVDADLLEAALQGAVALEVLRYSSSVVAPIGLQLAAASAGLRSKPRRSRLGGARPDEVDGAVDEQDDVAALGDLLITF